MSILKQRGKYDLSAVEALIEKRLKKPKTVSTVGELVEQLRVEYGIPETVALKALRRLQDANRVELERPDQAEKEPSRAEPLEGFQWLLRTAPGRETIMMLILLGLSLLVVLVVPQTIPGGIPLIQIPLGLALVLFFPGFALVSMLLPDALNFLSLERIVLSFGFSLVLVPLITVSLNFTPQGITTESTTTMLVLFTAAGMIIAGARKYRASTRRLHPKNVASKDS